MHAPAAGTRTPVHPRSAPRARASATGPGPARGWHLRPPPGVREGMRNEVLRDVIAGSAGVLVVLALIGLPKDPAPTRHEQVHWQGIHLLPYYSHSLRSPAPRQAGTQQIRRP